MFINGIQISECSCKPYIYNKEYDENTIGCGVVLDFIGKEGEEHLKNNFCGEMSALHFVEINNKTLFVIHSTLNRIFPIVDMYKLFPLIAYGNSHFENWPELQAAISYKELTDSNIIEHQFMILNPKYAIKWGRESEKIYCKKIGKHLIEINNQVERVYQQTKIHHNAPARDVFLSIQGISNLLPLLYELCEFDLNQEMTTFKYILIM